MQTITIPQKNSIYREIAPIFYSYDEDTGDLTCCNYCIIKDVSINEWGMLRKHHRVGDYGKINDALNWIKNDKHVDWLF